MLLLFLVIPLEIGKSSFICNFEVGDAVFSVEVRGDSCFPVGKARRLVCVGVGVEDEGRVCSGMMC